MSTKYLFVQYLHRIHKVYSTAKQFLKLFKAKIYFINGLEETFGDVCIYYTDCGKGFTGIKTCLN